MSASGSSNWPAPDPRHGHSSKARAMPMIHFSCKKVALCLILACLTLLGARSAKAAILYTDSARPDDSGDGLSWATAKKTLQSAGRRGLNRRRRRGLGQGRRLRRAAPFGRWRAGPQKRRGPLRRFRRHRNHPRSARLRPRTPPSSTAQPRAKAATPPTMSST